MLIICNGNFKSGSTWLHFIVSEILKLKGINIFDTKEKYTNNVNSPTSIVESKLNEFLINEDYKTNYYLTKSHYLSKKTFNMKADKNIKFFFIDREINDVIVSHFHHFKIRIKLKLSFQTYFFFIGKLKAYEVLNLRKLYSRFSNEKNSFLYSDLINNFEDSVNKISKYLDLGDFVHTFGDAHIYSNHTEQIELQLSRKPRKLPTLNIKRKVDSIFDFKFEDFEIINYDPHPHIKGKVSV